MKALLKQIKSGPNKGRYRFELYGVNGERMSTKQEVWDDEGEMRTHVMNEFPNFNIVDTTPEDESVENPPQEAQDEEIKTLRGQPAEEGARLDEQQKNAPRKAEQQQTKKTNRKTDDSTDRGIL